LVNALRYPDGHLAPSKRRIGRCNERGKEDTRWDQLSQDHGDPKGEEKPDPQESYPPDPSCIGNPQREQRNCKEQG